MKTTKITKPQRAAGYILLARNTNQATPVWRIVTPLMPDRESLCCALPRMQGDTVMAGYFVAED